MFQNGQSIFQETLARRCSVKKVFLEISQNSQENICARVSFVIKLQALAQVFSSGTGVFYSKNSFSFRTPPVAASAFQKYYIKCY